MVCISRFATEILSGETELALGTIRVKWARWLKRQGAELRVRRPGFDPGCRRGGDFSSLLRVQTGPGVHSASYKMSTGVFPGVKAAERRTSAVAVNMWTLASTSPVGLHGL